MARLRTLLAAVFASAGMSAEAQELTLSGFADLRVAVPSNDEEWTGGGLGKLRYGGDAGPRFGEASALANLQITSELAAAAHVRAEPAQRTALDLIEAYARWRPVSTSPWRWQVKAGAFFPPLSLENEGIGWTSLWTLTPSAINSWVGEELRTIGGEARLEWRGAEDRLSAVGAAYGWNDPAGILLAYRGWALHDRWTGLNDRPRLPDEIAGHMGRTPPVRTDMAREIDDRVGWYGGLSWERPDLFRLTALRYDNRADPRARREQVAWRTEFWSLGAEWFQGEVVVLAQAMRGETEVWPNAANRSITDFESAYLLVGWEPEEDWRVAARVDAFGTSEQSPAHARRVRLGEHGKAYTAAVTWRPLDRLRLTAELVHVDSRRLQRTAEGDPADAEETLFQLAVRVFF